MTSEQHNSIIKINSNELVQHINKFKSIAIYEDQQYNSSVVELINNDYNNQTLILNVTAPNQTKPYELLVKPVLSAVPSSEDISVHYDWKVIAADGYTNVFEDELLKKQVDIVAEGLKIYNQWKIHKFITVQAIAYARFNKTNEQIYMAQSNVVTIYENSEDLISAIVIDLSNDNATVPFNTTEEDIIKDLTYTKVSVLRGDSDLSDNCSYQWEVSNTNGQADGEFGFDSFNTREACLKTLNSTSAKLTVTITIPKTTEEGNVVLSKSMNIARGTRGAQGKGISAVQSWYAATENEKTYPSLENLGTENDSPASEKWWDDYKKTGHSATAPYLWKYETTTYSDEFGNEEKSTKPEMISFYSKEIDRIVDWYYINNDATSVPECPTGDNDEDWKAKGWQATVPVTSQSNRYIWNCEVIVYTDNSRDRKTPVIVSIEGKDGADGISFSSVENWYTVTIEKNAPSRPTNENPTDWFKTVAETNFGKRVTNDEVDLRVYRYLWNAELVTSKNSEGTTFPVWSTPQLLDTYEGGRIPIEYINYFAVHTTATEAPENEPILDAEDDYNSIKEFDGSSWTKDESALTINSDVGVYLFEKTFCKYQETDIDGKNLYADMGVSIAGYNGTDGDDALVYRLIMSAPVINITNLSGAQTYNFSLQQVEGNTITTINELPNGHVLTWKMDKDGAQENRIESDFTKFEFTLDANETAKGIELVWKDENNVVIDNEYVSFVQNGSDYTGLILSTSAQVFKETGDVCDPLNAVITAKLYGDIDVSSTTVTWSGYPANSTVNGNILTVPGSSITGSTTITATYEKYSDSITLYKLTDGLTAYLTNPSISFSAEADGIVKNAQKVSEIKVFQGITDITDKITQINVPNSSTLPSGMSVSSNHNDSKAEIIISVISGDLGGSKTSVDGILHFSIVLDSPDVTLPLSMSWTKNIDGDTSSYIEYYQATSTNEKPNRYNDNEEITEFWKTSIGAAGQSITTPYLWNFERVTYASGETPTDSEVSLLSSSPRGIAQIVEYYAKNTTGTIPTPGAVTTDITHNTAPTIDANIWKTERPSLEQGDYLYNFEVIQYSAVDAEGKNLYSWTEPVQIGYAGIDGTNYTNLMITATSQTFVKNPNNSNAITPDSITLTPNLYGDLKNKSVTWYQGATSITETSTSAYIYKNGNQLVIKSGAFGSNTSLTFTAKAKVNSTDTEEYDDTYTLYLLTEGLNGTPGDPAYSAFLTDQSWNFSADKDGEVLANVQKTTTVKVFKGTEEQNVKITGVEGSLSSYGVISFENLPTLTFTTNASNLGSDNSCDGQIIITAVADSKTFTLGLSWDKTNTGATGEQGIPGNDGADGTGIKQIITYERSLTYAQWTQPQSGKDSAYTAIGHSELWWTKKDSASGENIPNTHIVVGDTAYLVGNVSDRFADADKTIKQTITIYGLVTKIEDSGITMTTSQVVWGGTQGEPGKQGEPGNDGSYVYLLPSTTSITKAGNYYYPSKITLNMMKKVGDGAPEVATGTFKYTLSIDGVTSSDPAKDFVSELDISSLEPEQSIVISIYDANSKRIDVKTISINVEALSEYVLYNKYTAGTLTLKPINKSYSAYVSGTTDANGWYAIQDENSFWQTKKSDYPSLEGTKNGAEWGTPVRISGVLTNYDDLYNLLEGETAESNKGLYQLPGNKIGIDADVIKAGAIKIGESGPENLRGNKFYVDMNYTQPTYMAGWEITNTGIKSEASLGTENSFHMGTADLGSATIAGTSRSNWRLGIGPNFGVTSKGEVFASSGKIGNVNISNIASTKINPNLFIGSTDDQYWMSSTGTLGGANGEYWIEWNGTTGGGTEKFIYHQPFGVEIGKTYTLSFDAKKTDNLISSEVFILQSGFPSGQYVLNWTGFSNQLTQEYKRFSHIFTVPNYSGNMADCDLRFDHNGSTDGKDATLWVRNIKLEEGTEATAWSLAPEDVATTAQLTVLNNAIQAKVENSNTQGSVGWSMNDEEFKVEAIEKGVTGGITVDSNGLKVIGEITATSLQLGNNVTIPSASVSGIDNYVKQDALNDYVTDTDLSKELLFYAKSEELNNYLLTDNLDTQLSNLNVAYRGDVETTQSTDQDTGITTTTSTYIGLDGKKHTTTTYTTDGSNYVLLNRNNQWGSGNSLVKIAKDGLLEANNAIITGTVYATDGEFTGTINATGGNIDGVQIGEIATTTQVNEVKDEIEKKGYQTEEQVTQITKDTVTTTYIESLQVTAQTIKSPDYDPGNGTESALNFTLIGDHYKVGLKATGIPSEVIIPERYNGKPVTELDVGSFTAGQNIIEKLAIPANIITNPFGLLTGYTKLVELHLPVHQNTENPIFGNWFGMEDYSGPGGPPYSLTSIYVLGRNGNNTIPVDYFDVEGSPLKANVYLTLTITALSRNALRYSGNIGTIYYYNDDQFTATDIANAGGRMVKTNETYSYPASTTGFCITSKEDSPMIDSPNFKVTQNGEIIAEKGAIGGWNIAKTGLSASGNTGDELGSVGMYYGSDWTGTSLITGNQSPIRFYAGRTPNSQANFAVLEDGSVYMTAGEIGSEMRIVNNELDYITFDQYITAHNQLNKNLQEYSDIHEKFWGNAELSWDAINTSSEAKWEETTQED